MIVLRPKEKELQLKKKETGLKKRWKNQEQQKKYGYQNAFRVPKLIEIVKKTLIPTGFSFVIYPFKYFPMIDPRLNIKNCIDKKNT